MTLGFDAVVVGTPFENFTVRVQRGGARPVGEPLELARWAARQFRFGIDMNDPAVVRAALELVRLLDGSGFGFDFGVERESVREPFSLFGSAFGGIAARLEEELLAGRLVVERERITALSERRDLFEPKLPPLPPPRRESTTHTFEVRFVDETGKAISGIDAEFTADGAQTRSTNAAGVALLEGVVSSTANVAILDPEALAKVLDPRWEGFRRGAPPKESNTQQVVFRGAELGPFKLKAEVPNTVVIKPPLGRLFVELWDKTGRIRHANRTYQINGPQAFEGTTDADGRLAHEDVFPGNYELSLALDFFEENDPDRAMDVVDSQLVVLPAGAAQPQVRMLGGAPRSVLARLQMFFNTNKTFLLPSALPAIRKLRELYENNAPCQLLVVGHADTTAGNAYNDRLSLERARATVAFLEDDAETWFAFYGQEVEAKKRWGKVEDHLMIISMPDFVSKPKGEDPVRWYQRTRGLEIDGAAGRETRHALIHEYMSLDDASLRDFEGKIEAVAHGCGENFPLDDTGEELDAAPADAKRDPIDRRVELFFFDDEFGITPPPPGDNSAPGSAEYPLWRKRVLETVELTAGDPDAPDVTFVELGDAHFRTDSAVVLPEGEDPDASGQHQAFTSLGVIATALRFNEEHPGRTLLVAGHADTTNTPAFNQPLSEERAQLTLALLEGGDSSRETFKKLAQGRHTVADIKQVLSWVASALPGFDCDPGAIDDNLGTATGPIRNFQNSYNAQRATIAPSSPSLTADGSVGPLTWGAIFDCYEFALQEELGEDAAGLAALRSKLAFVDPSHKSLGFSEYFPIEELGVDNFRSQSNRRVEILFFEQGEEPDILHAVDDPETSDLYLPGHFERTPLQPLRAALGMRNLRIFLLGADGLPSSNAPYRLRTASQVRQGVSGPNGEVLEDQVFADSTCEIEWGTANDSAATPIFPNYAEVFLNTAAPDTDADLANRQLFNLGYWHDDESSRRQAFQAEYNEPDTSDPSVSDAHTTGKPKQQRILG